MESNDELDVLRGKLHEYELRERERAKDYRRGAEIRARKNKRTSTILGLISLFFLVATYALREGMWPITWSIAVTLLAAVGFGIMAIMEKDRVD